MISERILMFLGITPLDKHYDHIRKGREAEARCIMKIDSLRQTCYASDRASNEEFEDIRRRLSSVEESIRMMALRLAKMDIEALGKESSDS